MTTRLQLYNGALGLCGDTRLATLDENREARHLLDLAWNNGAVRACLEQAQWKFAMRSKRFDYDATIVPEFGFQRAYEKPSDWVATSGIFSDDYMRQPLTLYADEAGFWYCDNSEIFVRFVSDHADYGGDLSAWPATFCDYVEAYLAGKIAFKSPGAAEKVVFLHGPAGRPDRGFIHAKLLIAKNKDAMAGPATFPTRGTWAQARHRGRSGRSDGGSTSNLIG